MGYLERFLRYVRIDTVSENSREEVPSSPAQWEFARGMVEELKELGVEDAFVDEHCTVYGHIPATKGFEGVPSIGFLAHMDTVQNGHGISPQVYENYDGKDFHLKNGRPLSARDWPELPSLKGRTLICSDGSTILGADDKAGIVAIMELIALLKEKHLSHGRVCIAFTPDEEVGRGVDCFNLQAFGADFALTVDGGKEDEIEAENFNAATLTVDAQGVQTHTGSAKGLMVNAMAALCRFHSLLPQEEVPEKTEGREGFFHLIEMQGNVEVAHARYLIRDFDRDQFEERKALAQALARRVNEELGREVVQAKATDSYYNMAPLIKEHPELLKNLEGAMKKVGLTPSYALIRGGTDGARLTYMGLPCPNIGAGGYAFHSLCEHVTLEGMELATQVCLEFLRSYTQG